MNVYPILNELMRIADGGLVGMALVVCLALGCILLVFWFTKHAGTPLFCTVLFALASLSPNIVVVHGPDSTVVRLMIGAAFGFMLGSVIRFMVGRK